MFCYGGKRQSTLGKNTVGGRVSYTFLNTSKPNIKTKIIKLFLFFHNYKIVQFTKVWNNEKIPTCVWYLDYRKQLSVLYILIGNVAFERKIAIRSTHPHKWPTNLSSVLFNYWSEVNFKNVQPPNTLITRYSIQTFIIDNGVFLL